MKAKKTDNKIKTPKLKYKRIMPEKPLSKKEKKDMPKQDTQEKINLMNRMKRFLQKHMVKS